MHDIDRTLSLAEMQDSADKESGGFEEAFDFPDEDESRPVSTVKRRTSLSGRWIRRGNQIILLGV